MLSVRLRAVAAALALAPAAVLLSGSPAQAASSGVKVTSVTVSKSAFVLSSKAGCTASVTFTAKLNKALPASGYSFAGVGVDLYQPGATSTDLGAMFKQVNATTYRGSVALCGSYKAGNFKAKVYGAMLPDGGSPEFTNKITKTISVKRPSKATLNAAPEPVKKGKQLTAKGVLKSDGKLLAGASVRIYFKPATGKTWIYKGTAKTNAKGVYSKKFTAAKTGTWKAVYAGTAARNAASAVDTVKVVK
jgi:hypothetical protein